MPAIKLDNENIGGHYTPLQWDIKPYYTCMKRKINSGSLCLLKWVDGCNSRAWHLQLVVNWQWSQEVVGSGGKESRRSGRGIWRRWIALVVLATWQARLLFSTTWKEHAREAQRFQKCWQVRFHISTTLCAFGFLCHRFGFRKDILPVKFSPQ